MSERLTTRKYQESVVVGGTDRFQRMLQVTVLEIQSGKVRLGFDANSNVPVHRLEVWERIPGRDKQPRTLLVSCSRRWRATNGLHQREMSQGTIPGRTARTVAGVSKSTARMR